MGLLGCWWPPATLGIGRADWRRRWVVRVVWRGGGGAVGRQQRSKDNRWAKTRTGELDVGVEALVAGAMNRCRFNFFPRK